MGPSELLRIVATKLESLGIHYLVTGSTATIAFGEPRFTNDLDIVVSLQPSQIEAFCDSFPPGEFYLSQDAVRDAVRRGTQFNVIHPFSGLKVDFIILGHTDFDVSRASRGVRLHPEPDYEATFASAEDVIIKKLEYYRQGGSEKHLRDITGVLKVQGDRLDRAYVVQWAARMGLSDIWQAVLNRVEHRGT
jgi:hypothetical protein